MFLLTEVINNSIFELNHCSNEIINNNVKFLAMPTKFNLEMIYNAINADNLL